jgi:hypothetical protein
MKHRNSIFRIILLVLVCFGCLPGAQAVSPAPDGGYAGGNTAEGQSAMLSLSGGTYNTAVGLFALETNTTGNFNTAVGAGTLLVNTTDNNTATGAAALLSNTTGGFNTANGAFALFSNTSGSSNTAIGDGALLGNTTGSDNAAIGNGALNRATGDNNVALGYFAGFVQTTGTNNVYIGANADGQPGESNACYIASIFGQTAANGSPVFITNSNKLGTDTSSKRFKEDIKPMARASEALLALKPVSFRYKKEIDPAGIPQFGLVAEDVEKVNAALVVRDKEGKPYTVRYEQINAMLLNEFLKEHKIVEEQQTTITKLRSTVAQQRKEFEARAAKQQEEIRALTVGLQQVSAQLAAGSPSRHEAEVSKSVKGRSRHGGAATRVALNNR